MKRIVTFLSIIISFGLLLVSCNSEPSLQRYFVDHQELPNFMSQDVPISMLKVDEASFTAAQQEAYKSVRRLNFLGFKNDSTNTGLYTTELSKVRGILKQDKYQDLVEFSDKGKKVLVKYIGDDEEADEVIVLVSADDMGFALVRILGDHMSPEKMVTLAEALNNADIDESQMQNMMDFFK